MKITGAQWVAWLGATLTAAVTLTAFAYSNFQTKEDAKSLWGILNDRLDRMEAKLDRVVENTK